MIRNVKKLGCVSQDVGSKKDLIHLKRLHSRDRKRQEVGLCLSGCWIKEGLDKLEKTPQP